MFPTESVTFSCGIERDSSNWIYTWHKDKKQVLADGNVSFDVSGAKLSITAASADHAGQYQCSGRLQNRAVTSKDSAELHLTVHGEFYKRAFNIINAFLVCFHTEMFQIQV